MISCGERFLKETRGTVDPVCRDPLHRTPHQPGVTQRFCRRSAVASLPSVRETAQGLADNISGGEAMSSDDDDNQLLSLLDKCQPEMSWGERLKTLKHLLVLVESQRVRDDVEDKLPRKIYSFILESIRLGWDQPGERLAQACWTGLVGLEEFEDEVAGGAVDDGFLDLLCARFQAGVEEERAFLRDMLHWAYASFPKKRRLLRQKMCAVLGYFMRTPSRSVHVAELLEVMRLIIKGFPSLTKVRTSSPHLVVGLRT